MTVGVSIVNPPLSLLSLIPPSPPPPLPSPALILLAEILGQTVAVVNSLADGARLGPSQYRRGWPQISLGLQVCVLQTFHSESWTGETRLLEDVVGSPPSPASLERLWAVQPQVVQSNVLGVEERFIIIVSAWKL